MDERAKRAIEAMLDPRGKWYGRPWFGDRQETAPDAMLMPAEEDDAAAEAETDPEPWMPGRTASPLDEWEPA
jgi:hypothetical protein